MHDPEQANDRLLFLRGLRELTAEGIEQQFADQQRAWKLLLEEENRATIERIATCKSPTVFAMELATTATRALLRRDS